MARGPQGLQETRVVLGVEEVGKVAAQTRTASSSRSIPDVIIYKVLDHWFIRYTSAEYRSGTYSGRPAPQGILIGETSIHAPGRFRSRTDSGEPATQDRQFG